MKYFPLLYTPYRIYTVLIRYLGLLDSQQVWCKLIKSTSLLKVVTLEQAIEIMIERWEQGSMEAIDTRWGVISVLALLVVVWLRLGGHFPSDIVEDPRSISIAFTVARHSDNSELIVLISGSRSLHKTEISKLLYRTILG